MSEQGLSLSEIVKDFPGVRALDGASLKVRAGEVHGLVGENGAGKSTIIKVLAGVYKADAGSLEIDGVRIDPVTPEAIHAAGVRFIHQELHLVPHFTVAESVFMGQAISGPLGLRSRDMRQRAEAFLREVLAVNIAGNRLIRELGTAERKLVQIARALVDEAARIVVFDEPTAPLASEEIATLMRAISRLKEREIAIVYISHYLSEIIDICDRVTVFRQGRDVAVFDDVHAGIGKDMVSAMVGRALDEVYPSGERQTGEPVLELQNFGHADMFRGIDLTLHRGEILGIAGLIGSGRSELIDTVYGLRRATEGAVRFDGAPVRIASPSDAVACGIVLVPRDRRNEGLVLPMSVSENVNLANLDEVSVAGLEQRSVARKRAEEQIRSLDIRPTNPGTITRFLSGGNQQKVVLGRWLAKQAHVFLMDEPTVGVDVGAKVEIYQLIERLAKAGAGVLISSSDPAELIGLCDRVVVMMRGKIVETVETDGMSIDQLVAVTTGALSVKEARPV